MKKNLLKLTFLGFFLFALSFNSDAQIRVGGGLVFNAETAPDLGLNFRAEVGIGDAIVIAPNFTYYFKTFGITVTEINGDVHYPFDITESVTVYPLGGLNVSSIGDTKIGINLGGGAQFGISDNLRVFAELKYIALIEFYSPVVIGGGVLFEIGG